MITTRMVTVPVQFTPTNRTARNCGDASIESGRGPGQLPWYQYATRFVAGKTVLDAGCGLGHGTKVLGSVAKAVHGLDCDPQLAGPNVTIGDVADLPAKSYDVVVSIDVVEHVKDPEAFVRHLARIARLGVFITTPNWTASRCQWPFHIREYTPRQFAHLLSGIGDVHLLKGTPSGSEVYPIRFPRMHNYLNDLRSFFLTALPTCGWNHLLPRSARVHSHNAAWVQLG